MGKITDKQSCANCIHKEVCNIYEYAKQYNKTSGVKFAPHKMVDVCGKYKRNLQEQLAFYLLCEPLVIKKIEEKQNDKQTGEKSEQTQKSRYKKSFIYTG